MTELRHANGFQYIGPLPAEVQKYTVWAAGVHRRAPQADAAQAFNRALRLPDGGDAIRKSGMDAI